MPTVAPAREGTSNDDVRLPDNIIRVSRAELPGGWPPHLRTFYFGAEAEGSAVVGIAIVLDGAWSAPAEGSAGPAISNVLVERNRVIGGEGLGIELVGASGNRIVDNYIYGIRRRAPFPGLTWGEDPERWRDANGSGIWVSNGSDGNRIEGNRFEAVEGAEIHVSGENNEIRLLHAGSTVRDEGRGNRIRRGAREGPGRG